jgi:formylglycine-generating enzyme required for sulfatase activity
MRLAAHLTRALAATALAAFTFVGGSIVPSSRPIEPTSRRAVRQWLPPVAYAIVLVWMSVGFAALFGGFPNAMQGLGGGPVLLAVTLLPTVIVAYIFHRQAALAVLITTPLVCAAIYVLARIALADLVPSMSQAIIPADVGMEDGHVVAVSIGRDGAAMVDRDGATAIIGGHGAPVTQSFLLADGTEVLTVAEDGTARITHLQGARLRSGFDAPRLAEIVRSLLWQPHGALLARWALLAAAQFLPMEIPEAARGRTRRAFRDCDQCPEIVEIEHGYFFMGSPFTEPGRYLDDSPRRLVMVGRPFAAGRFAVTFDDWDACVADGGCNGYKPVDGGWGHGLRPVINVSWEDASAYVDWLSMKTGKPYRLLSEAEWEYAARAGSNTAYPWGDEIGKNNANCRGCDSQWDDNQTAPVGSFKPNAFGLYDMSGNVWQWVQDCYHGNYNAAPADGLAWTSGDCSRHVVRGGSGINYPGDLRSAYRHGVTSGSRLNSLGFRVGRSVQGRS